MNTENTNTTSAAELLTPAQAAVRKGVSGAAIYAAIAAERLPSERVLGRIGLRPADVDACEFGSYGGKARASKPRGNGNGKGVPRSEETKALIRAKRRGIAPTKQEG